MRSILPNQPGQTEVHKPKAYAARLSTSQAQLSQAAILETLVNSENKPRIVSKQAGPPLARPIRWTIAAVLLLVLLIIAALGTKVFPTPSVPGDTSQVGMFFKVITGLPDGSPVLVVTDYQPGFAGELETAAAPIMEHLMSKKTRLAFISTSPFSDLLAERLLQKFSKVYLYRAGVQYVNLGYLPGGAASIKVFAESPESTLGTDVISGNLWSLSVLQDVTVNSVPRLSNFAAVIVVTDNPDTGRLWIEQAHSSLGTSPMLMVVSSQAEPMIQPYLFSNQINGLVAGLEGGMLYESARGKYGQARTYWDSFGAGMLVIELLIFVGGAWSLLAGWRARRTSMDQDEA